MREVIIASSVRTPVGRAYKGTLRATRPDELAAIAIKGALERVPQLDPKEIEDVILGCAMPEAEQGMNVARIASLRAGLPVEVSALTINRFCSSGLQAIAMAAERIMSGGAEVIVAGGTESMSMIPMGGHKISPNPWLVDHYPDAYLTMGLTAERLAQRFGITREEADEFSSAQPSEGAGGDSGRKVRGRNRSGAGELHHSKWLEAEAAGNCFQNGRRSARRYFAGSSARALKPAFHVKGTVTAGNSSQMSDGAAAAVVMSAERAKALGHQAAGALCCVCYRRIQARRNGTRPGVCDSESSENGGTEALRHRCDRVERSLRGAVAGRDQRRRARSRKSESEWRRDRAGASVGMHRSQADGHRDPRTEASQRTLRHGHDVRRRRHGRGRDFREL